MKIVLFVEGHTEQLAVAAFIKKYVDARVEQKARVTPVRFKGWADYWDNIEKRAELHLSGRNSASVACGIGLLDLYGPDKYPQDVKGIQSRYDWAKSEIETRVSNEKFRQHFAVHELEAWLLSDPSIHPRNMRREIGRYEHDPESKNFDEPPGQFLRRVYRAGGQRFKKTIDGADLFSKLSPERVYDRCTGFRRLVDDILQFLS